jgi:hypothetical protein
MTRKSTWTNSDGLVVGYGPNLPDFTDVGQTDKDGHERELRIVIDGEKFSGGVYQFVNAPELPAGAVPLYGHVVVSEVFALGGTTPTIQVGTDGSGAASVFGAVSQANAQALGTYNNTVTATPLTATTKGKVRISLGGTTPTVTAAGRATIIIGYRQPTAG